MWTLKFIQFISLEVKEGSSSTHAEQFNEREGETATLFGTSLVKCRVVAGGFAPRYLRRYVSRGKIRHLKF